MNEKFYDKKFDNALLDSYDDNNDNYLFKRKHYCENNEESNYEEKSEILWSRGNKYFSENDFFLTGDGSLTDLTPRSTSSCSWHNDDFDMKSSTKVSLSLEAVENALYENRLSPFISEEVFRECCSWSSMFPYLRLKGEQIINSQGDSTTFSVSDQKESLSTNYKNSPLNLHIEGKKIALHMPDKACKKLNYDTILESEPEICFEEIVAGGDEYKELNIREGECMHVNTVQENQYLQSAEDDATLDYLQGKVIEKLAQHVWPKVLEILQRSHTTQKSVAAQVEYKKFIPYQRPKTEGTNLSVMDFPKLSSILSVSPKILQDRKECRSGSLLRSSRPSSEIHLSSRKNVVSLQDKSSLKMPNASKQVQFFPKKGLQIDNKYDKVPLYLPALEEDIVDPIDHLKGVSIQTESKTSSTSVITHFPKTSECFLPPIDTNDNLHPDLKLTRNLFTFFGSDLKCSSKKEMVFKPKTPASRPNTSASRRGMKQSDNFNYKFMKDNYSSINNPNQSEIRKNDTFENQVTLFPIVTSLIPSKEKCSSSTKKRSRNTLSGCKR